MSLGRNRSRNIRPQSRVTFHSSRQRPLVETDEGLIRAAKKLKSRKQAEEFLEEHPDAPQGYVYCGECLRLVRRRQDGKMQVHSAPGVALKPWTRCVNSLEATDGREWAQTPQGHAYIVRKNREYYARRKALDENACPRCMERVRMVNSDVCVVCSILVAADE